MTKHDDGLHAHAADVKAKDDRRHRLEEEAKKLSAAEIEARKAELEEELLILQRGVFVEYPKMLPDGRVVKGPEEEAEALNPPKDEPPHTQDAKKKH